MENYILLIERRVQVHDDSQIAQRLLKYFRQRLLIKNEEH